MSAIWTVTFECNAPDCYRFATIRDKPSPDACEDAAREQGWDIPGDGKHWCPEHSDE